MHCVSRGGCYLVNSCCDLQEDNRWRKESYQACWVSHVLETRPQFRMTLSETDSVRRESYKQQQVVHFLVERSPGQTLKLGRDGGVMTRHQLPLSPTSRAPHGANAAAFDRRVQQPVASEEEWDSWETSDLIKPARENFRASGLMSSPRHASHRAPKRE
ncbi:telethonin-like [Salarias fasciatus]|uniref:Telethonin-like n=1 Tax=Salarias fasciatus TaxID=181472 RepID=A0A672FQI5_SALFA|nr:telethonin-like [Salarias fasciatus]